MQHFLRIIEQMRWGQKRLVIFTACYMLLMTAASMTTPTNATFMSETTVKGQVVMGDSFEKGSNKLDEERHDKSSVKEETRSNQSEQGNGVQAGDDSSLDEENEGNSELDKKNPPEGENESRR